MWRVLTTPEYRTWFWSLPDREKVRLERAHERLAAEGPHLRRPYADTVKGSRHPNLKELRTPGAVRAFYAFDTQRRAVLLCGGSKAQATSSAAWYKKMVRRADRILDQHLAGSRARDGGSDPPKPL